MTESNGALDAYFDAIARDARAATGLDELNGTVVAAEADRAGTGSATSYPLPEATVVWCDPALLATLSSIVDTDAITTAEFVGRATAMGATVSGFGNNRVLDGDLDDHRSGPEADIAPSSGGTDSSTPGAIADADGLETRWLHTATGTDDLALLNGFVEACGEDDVDEADLDLDDLDPYILGVVERGDDGPRLAAIASARPSQIDDSFDDIAVLVHPAHRRGGLGAFAVRRFVEMRLADEPGRRMLYRCTTENDGSNALAERLGFRFAHTIGAVSFDTP